MDVQPEEEVGLSEASRELDKWKLMVEDAVSLKEHLILEKLEEVEKKNKMKKEAMDWLSRQEESEKVFTEKMNRVQAHIVKLENSKKELLAKLQQSRARLLANQEEASKLKHQSKICAQLNTDVNFLSHIKDEACYSDQPIRGVFTVSQRVATPLQGGQALVTFEEEQVASQVLQLVKSSVKYENYELKVRTRPLHLDPYVKFEVHLEVSRRQVKVSNVPPSLSEERVKDRLEISFSKPSRGGGEVERVDYDRNNRTGHIVFLHPGVADRLAVRGAQQVDLDPVVSVQVGPVFSYQLRRFQTFQGSTKRTVLLEGIQDVGDEEDLQDHLEIHFQKPINGGGEIDCIKYLSRDQTLLAFFNDDTNNTEGK